MFGHCGDVVRAIQEEETQGFNALPSSFIETLITPMPEAFLYRAEIRSCTRGVGHLFALLVRRLKPVELVVLGQEHARMRKNGSNDNKRRKVACEVGAIVTKDGVALSISS